MVVRGTRVDNPEARAVGRDWAAGGLAGTYHLMSVWGLPSHLAPGQPLPCNLEPAEEEKTAARAWASLKRVKAVPLVHVQSKQALVMNLVGPRSLPEIGWV